MYRYIFNCLFGVLFFMFLSSLQLKAQVSIGGIPPGMNFKSSLKKAETIREIPVNFDINKLKIEDAENEMQGLPLRVSTIIPVDLNMENSGGWILLPDSQKIWQLKLKAPGAIACMLYYDEFYIPEGGRLFIYNEETNHVLGAYTRQTNLSGGIFATEFLKGENITVEYVQPPMENPDVENEPASIRITGLGYGYNHLDLHNDYNLRAGAGSCEVNINCSEGELWRHQKKGVAKTVARIGNSSYLCSGSLVNNTSDAVIPYYLSARHCFFDAFERQAVFSSMVFYFHYEYPDCENLTVTPDPKTMTGAELLVAIDLKGGSDGALLKLKNEIPDNYDVFYNGWNSNNTEPTSGVSIHHPRGDVKKISTYTSKVASTTWRSPDGTGATNAHLNVIFSKTANGHGVTEDGSSGSPLFDRDKRIVGTLTGGNSSCITASGSNFYGKLWYHWDRVDTAQMKTYLDPLQTGIKIINGRYTDPLYIDFSADKISIDSDDSITFENLSYGYTSFEWSFPGGNPSSSSSVKETVHFATPGIYDISLTIYNGSERRIKTISVEVKQRSGLIVPESLVAEAGQDRKVVLNWNIYDDIRLSSGMNEITKDTLRWGSSDVSYKSRTTGAPVYNMLSTWTPEDLAEHSSLKIKSILFLVSEDSLSYKLKIYSGSSLIYSQSLNELKSNQYNTVELTTPVDVDLSKELFFGFEVIQGTDTYPITYDGGSILSGKNVRECGNAFYPAESLAYPNNWRIAAIVESEKAQKFTFNVYRNNQQIASGLTNTFYEDADVPAAGGNYCYRVSTISGEDGSEFGLTNSVCVFVGPLGIENLPVPEVTIAPNPVADILLIESGQSVVNNLVIADINGRILLSAQPLSNKCKISTNDWSTGVYFVRVTTPEGIVVHKIIKSR